MSGKILLPQNGICHYIKTSFRNFHNSRQRQKPFCPLRPPQGHRARSGCGESLLVDEYILDKKFWRVQVHLIKNFILGVLEGWMAGCLSPEDSRAFPAHNAGHNHI